jgi:DNA-binding NarL/FixJ family response regulator
MAIKVFIYDDSVERRESLHAFLSLFENIKVVGTAENCSTVLQDMEQYTPDVVLMDINMPVADGIEGLKKIATTYPDIRVLMQTAFDDSDKIFTSIKNGAQGYILKNDNPQKLLHAIEEVYKGGAAMNPAIAKKVLDYFNPSEKKIANPLTERENEVLALLAEGFSYKMIAGQLEVTYSTVNTHTKSIYIKLHISSLGEAIAWYYKNKI